MAVEDIVIFKDEDYKTPPNDHYNHQARRFMAAYEQRQAAPARNPLTREIAKRTFNQFRDSPSVKALRGKLLVAATNFTDPMEADHPTKFNAKFATKTGRAWMAPKQHLGLYIATDEPEPRLIGDYYNYQGK